MSKNKAEAIEKLLLDYKECAFDKKLLSSFLKVEAPLKAYEEDALEIWRQIKAEFREVERLTSIPYVLAETPKLYAIDPLTAVSPLIESSESVKIITKVYTIFYLIVHFFDDHVEHRDKFYSKFLFKDGDEIETQRGAAPFSFLLMAQRLLRENINKLNISSEQKMLLENSINTKLLLQTKFFTAERKSKLSVSKVLEIKQRQVSGISFSVIADLVSPLLGLSAQQKATLEKGFIYLGSLTQITDDIRDIVTDTTLRNANIIRSALDESGGDWAKQISAIYCSEEEEMKKSLCEFYSTQELELIETIPFYPFYVDKEKVRCS